jgi:hypothetical protein
MCTSGNLGELTVQPFIEVEERETSEALATSEVRSLLVSWNA